MELRDLSTSGEKFQNEITSIKSRESPFPSHVYLLLIIDY